MLSVQSLVKSSELVSPAPNWLYVINTYWQNQIMLSSIEKKTAVPSYKTDLKIGLSS